MPIPLPKILMTDVVRSTHQGDSHGGVYLVDLETERVDKVLDWNAGDIDWEGRGGDRGLRGIALWRDRVIIAASDEIFFFDKSFSRLGSVRNPYLGLCHEIWVDGDRLLLTSTAFDSILEYDLASDRFVAGLALRVLVDMPQGSLIGPQHLTIRVFDPASPGGPHRGDTTHINMVSRAGAHTFLSGVRLPILFAFDGHRVKPFARIPTWTHNTRPWRDGVIYNSTGQESVCFATREGVSKAAIDVYRHDPASLTNMNLPKDVARPNFARGLTTWGGDPDRPGILIGGSSPSTVSVFDVDRGERIKTINFGKDVRNAPHGLIVWPTA
jgi:hypothetical protein